MKNSNIQLKADMEFKQLLGTPPLISSDSRRCHIYIDYEKWSFKHRIVNTKTHILNCILDLY